MRFFKHYANAANASDALNDLLYELGFEGYGRYWRLLEILSEKFDGLDTSFRIRSSLLRETLRFRSAKQLGTFMDLLATQPGYNVKLSGNYYEIEAPILLELQSRDFKKARSKRGTKAHKNKIKNKIKEEDKDKSKKAHESSNKNSEISAELIQNLWTKICGGKGKIKNFSLTFSGLDCKHFAETKQHLNTKEQWVELFETVADSRKLTGQDPKFDFVASLPWVIKYENVSKILYGNFQSVSNGNTATQSENYVREAMESAL